MDEEKLENEEDMSPAQIAAQVFLKAEEDIQQQAESPSASKIINEIHKAGVIHVAQTDENVKEQFQTQAKKTVQNELDTIEQENLTRRQKATYNANEDACRNYGIESSVPLWEIKLMKIGSAFWFVIYWIFASLTICPVSVFCKGIKAFIKHTWLALLFALIAYLIIVVGIPFLATWLATIK